MQKQKIHIKFSFRPKPIFILHHFLHAYSEIATHQKPPRGQINRAREKQRLRRFSQQLKGTIFLCGIYIRKSKKGG